MGLRNDAYLYNQGNNFLIGTGTVAKSLLFLTGGTDSAVNTRMRIDGSGNVGISNQAPAEKLDVTGNIRFSGTLLPDNLAGTAGNVLTSAGAGVTPTWVNQKGVIGTLGAGFNIVGTATGTYYCTGTSIMLPPGKYMVFAYMMCDNSLSSNAAPGSLFVKTLFADASYGSEFTGY